MKTLVNVNPVGAVFIAELGVTVERGAEFDAPDDVAKRLLDQVDNYQLKPNVKG